MKHLFLILAIGISTLGWTQNQVPLQRTVSVYGSTTTESQKNLYKCDVTLSLESNYYAENPCTTLEELKAKYFTELKKHKVDTTKFTEDPLAYAGMSYRKEGIILHFITDDKDEMLRMATSRMPQVNVSYIQRKSIIPAKELDKLIGLAIKDAYKNAKIFSKHVNYKVGKVVSVNSYSYNNETYWKSLTNQPEEIKVTVVYQLTD